LRFLFIDFESNQMVHFIDKDFLGIFSLGLFIPIEDLEIAIFLENHNYFFIYDISEISSTKDRVLKIIPLG
jgi:hypothetical protein